MPRKPIYKTSYVALQWGKGIVDALLNDALNYPPFALALCRGLGQSPKVLAGYLGAPPLSRQKEVLASAARSDAVSLASRRKIETSGSIFPGGFPIYLTL